MAADPAVSHHVPPGPYSFPKFRNSKMRHLKWWLVADCETYLQFPTNMVCRVESWLEMRQLTAPAEEMSWLAWTSAIPDFSSRWRSSSALLASSLMEHWSPFFFLRTCGLTWKHLLKQTDFLAMLELRQVSQLLEHEVIFFSCFTVTSALTLFFSVAKVLFTVWPDDQKSLIFKSGKCN